MTEAHPVAAYYVKRAKLKGAKIIVADPRYHALAKKADIFAQIKVGSDVAFLNGITLTPNQLRKYILSAIRKASKKQIVKRLNEHAL